MDLYLRDEMQLLIASFLQYMEANYCLMYPCVEISLQGPTPEGLKCPHSIIELLSGV